MSLAVALSEVRYYQSRLQAGLARPNAPGTKLPSPDPPRRSGCSHSPLCGEDCYCQGKQVLGSEDLDLGPGTSMRPTAPAADSFPVPPLLRSYSWFVCDCR